jgi:hypothetical protein
MKLYDNTPQAKAMQSLIHDTRNQGDTIRFHGQKLRERFKELGISDTKSYVHLEYVTGRTTEIEKAIDAYYERFSKDFPETEEQPYKPHVPDAYQATLKIYGTDEWDKEMLPTYHQIKKLMEHYTLIRKPNSEQKDKPSAATGDAQCSEP